MDGIGIALATLFLTPLLFSLPIAALLAGVEMGVISGVALGVVLCLWRASPPHAAIVRRVLETEHFRNIERHKVVTVPHVLSIRIDEALTYLNAQGPV